MSDIVVPEEAQGLKEHKKNIICFGVLCIDKRLKHRSYVKYFPDGTVISETRLSSECCAHPRPDDASTRSVAIGRACGVTD